MSFDRRRLVVIACVSLAAGTTAAQQVVLADGEVVAGRVVAVTGARAKVQLAAGGMRQLDVRSIDHSLVDGVVKRHAAELVDGPTPPAAASLLALLQQGKVAPEPELLPATAAVDVRWVEAVGELLTARLKPVRLQAALALVAASTGASLRRALDGARADAAVRGVVLRAATNGAALAAIAASDGLPDVEAALADQDRGTRGAAAWVAAKLGSDAALPVLAAFVTDADHHVRESAAMCLAERGHAAGAAVLLVIAKRERSPAMAANRDADPGTRQFLAAAARRERVRACELLGELRHAPAAAALRALAKHADAAIAVAARDALAKLEAAPGDTSGR